MDRDDIEEMAKDLIPIAEEKKRWGGFDDCRLR